MFTPAISIPKRELVEFCRRWEVTDLALFGSVLRQDFSSNSDIDLLVTSAPEAKHSLFDPVAMRDDLESIFGRKVDLVERKAVEQSENYIRRKHSL